MKTKVGAATVAGLAGGLVFGIVMQLMIAQVPELGIAPMLTMIGMIIGAPTLLASWLYHLFNSAIIGGAFGWLLGSHINTRRQAIGFGLTYGFFWWILGGLVLMPMLLGMSPFAPVTEASLQPLAWGSLVGHLLFGAVLGLAFEYLYKPEVLTPPRERRQPVGLR